MEYQIIATLGPASDTTPTWNALLSAGATAFRLNTSHLSLPRLRAWLEALTAFQAAREQPVPVILDLQGSKWRVGEFASFALLEGQPVELVYAAEASQPGTLPVPHADFFRAAGESSGEVVLNDAKIRLAVETLGAQSLRARVLQGGTISAHKGITFADSTYRTESFSEKDRAIVGETEGLAFIRCAISYIKDGAEMQRYRALVSAISARPVHLIAKLERGPAMADAERVASAADELWLCRGDLGAELGLRKMAEAVERFSEQVRAFSVPAIMAGQVLEHMTGAPTPTRSEVCYLYDTLRRGYAGFVLSDETAVGQYPLESCRAAALFKS